jgi:hypothetical protein
LPLNARADFSKKTQVHLLMGPISGSFSGASSGDFSVPSALNTEIEFIYDPKLSLILRNIIAFDATTSKNVYSLTSIGQRNYWRGSNLPLEINDKNGNKYTFRPKQRFYFGWDVGVSQAVITSLGPVLDAVSTMFDFGVNTGFIHQLGDNWGLEAQLGYTQTFGFSSVSVNGSTMRLLVGVAFYYE